MSEYKNLINKKDFVFLWLSQLLSQFTINIINFLLITSLYKTTGSTIAISLIWIFYALPVILIGPLASAWVDMFDKKKLLSFANLSQALLIFLYAYTHETSLFLLYGVVMLYSFINQFYVPAELASLPYVVSKDLLPNANGLFLLTQQSAVVFGFGFASLLFGKIGFEQSLFVCAALLLLAFISTLFLDKKKFEAAPNGLEKSFKKFFVHMIEGYSFLKNNRILLAPLSLIIGMQVALAISFTNLPIISEDLLKISAEKAGISLVAPAGIGAGLGALFVPKLLKKIRKISMIRHSFQIVIFSLLLISFSEPYLPEFIRQPLGFLSILLAGFSFVGIMIPSHTFLQEYTPEDLRGRVFGSLWFLTTIFTVFPILLSATIVEIFGIKLLLFILGGISLAVYILLRGYGEKLVYNSSLNIPGYHVR